MDLLKILSDNFGATFADVDAVSKFLAERKAKLLSLESSLGTAHTDLEETAAGLAAAIKDRDALKAQLATEKAEVKRLSLAVNASSMDAGATEVVAKAYESRITALQTSGKLSPESGRMLLSALVGPKGTRRKLSISGDAVLVNLPVDELLELLEKNEPKNLGTMTSQQKLNATEIVSGNAGQPKTFEQEVAEAQTAIKGAKPAVGN